MYNGILHLHNLMRWVILILLLINIVRHITAAARPFASADKKLGLWAMIAAHLTLVIGLYQYFAGGSGFKLFQVLGVGGVMKDAVARFWAVEHITGMLIGIVLITLARGVFRKNLTDKAKHRRALILYVLALVAIVAVIPWPGREVARPLFPGM
jgi:hypothetical protein